MENIVVPVHFLEAMRDSGYKGLSSAISELVDNSLQAKARRIQIRVQKVDDQKFEIEVLDDGIGMTAKETFESLRFGGSSRFDDRSGLGRFGMGLPNSSLSQSRSFVVYSWKSPASVSCASIDIDSGASIKSDQNVRFDAPTNSGTLVRWSKCDRLSYKKVETVIRHLSLDIGRVFRHFIQDGVLILINGGRVQPLDPLFLGSAPFFL